MAQQGAFIPSSATSTFPGCALSCSQLLQAQALCLPPNQAQSTQIVYDNCFCQSPLLAAFATTPDSICVAECSIESDRDELRAWFENFCAQVASGVDPTTVTASAATNTPVIATSTISITSGTLAATVTATGSSSHASHGSQSWFAGHWQWVLMLIILALGFLALTFLAIWLKRRHRRKVEARRAVASGFTQDPEKRATRDIGRSATPDLWGPHQMMQATQGYGYTTEGIPEPQPESSKRASRRARKEESTRDPEKEIIETTDKSRSASATRPSIKRARPSELEQNARLIGAADRRSKSKKKRDKSLGPDDKDVEAMPKGAPVDTKGPDEITTIGKT